MGGAQRSCRDTGQSRSRTERRVGAPFRHRWCRCGRGPGRRRAFGCRRARCRRGCGRAFGCGRWHCLGCAFACVRRGCRRAFGCRCARRRRGCGWAFGRGRWHCLGCAFGRCRRACWRGGCARARGACRGRRRGGGGRHAGCSGYRRRCGDRRRCRRVTLRRRRGRARRGLGLLAAAVLVIDIVRFMIGVSAAVGARGGGAVLAAATATAAAAATCPQLLAVAIGGDVGIGGGGRCVGCLERGDGAHVRRERFTCCGRCGCRRGSGRPRRCWLWRGFGLAWRGASWTSLAARGVLRRRLCTATIVAARLRRLALALLLAATACGLAAAFLLARVALAVTAVGCAACAGRGLRPRLALAALGAGRLRAAGAAWARRCGRTRTRCCRRGGGRRATEELRDAGKQARARGSAFGGDAHRRHGRRHGRRCGFGAFGRRGGAHHARHGGLLGFFARPQHRRQRRGRHRCGALVARLDLVAEVGRAQALDFQMRRLELVVGDHDDVDVVARLDFAELLALLVEQEVGHARRCLDQHLAGAVLHRVLLDQAQRRQRQRFHAADAAMAFAARADDLGGFAERGTQALA